MYTYNDVESMWANSSVKQRRGTLKEIGISLKYADYIFRNLPLEAKSTILNWINPQQNPERPPKEWWNKVWGQISYQYPRQRGETVRDYERFVSQVTAGIWWHRYNEETRNRLIQRYEVERRQKITRPKWTCPACDKPVSERDNDCPHCGLAFEIIRRKNSISQNPTARMTRKKKREIERIRKRFLFHQELGIGRIPPASATVTIVQAKKRRRKTKRDDTEALMDKIDWQIEEMKNPRKTPTRIMKIFTKDKKRLSSVVQSKPEESQQLLFPKPYPPMRTPVPKSRTTLKPACWECGYVLEEPGKCPRCGRMNYPSQPVIRPSSTTEVIVCPLCGREVIVPLGGSVVCSCGTYLKRTTTPSEELSGIIERLEEIEKDKNPTEQFDYTEALEGEGWAIGDYKDMISKSDSLTEQKTLKHILKEEQEHQDELLGLMREKNPLTPQEMEELASIRDSYLEEMANIDPFVDARRMAYLKGKAEALTNVLLTYDGQRQTQKEMGKNIPINKNPRRQQFGHITVITCPKCGNKKEVQMPWTTFYCYKCGYVIDKPTTKTDTGSGFVPGSRPKGPDKEGNPTPERDLGREMKNPRPKRNPPELKFRKGVAHCVDCVAYDSIGGICIDTGKPVLPLGAGCERIRIRPQLIVHCEKCKRRYLVPKHITEGSIRCECGQLVPVKRMVEKNPPTQKEVDSAAKSFETFHDFPAESAKKIKIPQPEVLVKIGEWPEVPYFSPKWKNKRKLNQTYHGKKGQMYTHEFEGKPGIVTFAPDKNDPTQGTILAWRRAKVKREGIVG
jgi:rubrerythrin